ncbi:MAG: thioredoxin [Chloroflexi bacterium]|nr:thioredoxin [Chloroflexota bacterium]MBM3173827.1 thioredoxin [Chloroflexota bacterium]MBM4450162.1 thioredoxin [Chloroflexota bacterium]MBM4454363.1 thioredoxin [Chloroflexota bacterium]
MAEYILNVNQDSFQKSVLEAQRPILVDFWAPWCGPCRAVAPVIEELAKEYQGKVDFAKVNVDESPFVASKFSVMSIPTLIMFKDGKPLEQVVGFKPKDQLKKLLDNTLTK